MSARSVATVCPDVGRIVAACTVPLPLPSRTEALALVAFAAATSMFPSPLRSPHDTTQFKPPIERDDTNVNVPLPLPRRSEERRVGKEGGTARARKQSRTK